MVKYALLGKAGTVDFNKYVCHVLTCMTEDVETATKVLWHAMIAMGHSHSKADAPLMLWHGLGLIPS
jgi:hypothetical protein